MQHRYVPDLGDFSKFVVIDALSAQGSLRSALIWYLADPDEIGESHRNDGKHTGYLSDDRRNIGSCHPSLYEKFQTIGLSGEKHVGVYSRQGVVANIAYAAEPLSYAGLSPNQRVGYRAGWASRALDACDGADLVFLDPDNGLASDSISLSTKDAVKYATLDECAAFRGYGSGQRSLVVYQHGHRQGTIEQQTDAALKRLSKFLKTSRNEAFALRFHRGTTRCYLVFPAKPHAEAMRRRAEAMVAGPWGALGHFSLIT